MDIRIEPPTCNEEVIPYDNADKFKSNGNRAIHMLDIICNYRESIICST